MHLEAGIFLAFPEHCAAESRTGVTVALSNATSVSLWGFALTAAIRGLVVFLLLSCTQKDQLLKALTPTSAIHRGAEPGCDPTGCGYPDTAVLATQNWEQVKSLSAEKVQQAQCQGSEVQDCPESILRRGEGEGRKRQSVKYLLSPFPDKKGKGGKNKSSTQLPKSQKTVTISMTAVTCPVCQPQARRTKCQCSGY